MGRGCHLWDCLVQTFSLVAIISTAFMSSSPLKGWKLRYK
ncbi:Uncharacterised protein [Vibrio cholerae]|nr:Uncharacterised protein [Vibrio cholerae]